MQRLGGKQIEEIAQLYIIKRRRLVALCSFVTLLLILSGQMLQAREPTLMISLVNIVLCCILAINIWHCEKHQAQYADTVLSSVLLFQTMVQMLYTTLSINALFWLFPIVGMIIWVNRFHVGLLFSMLFSAMVAVFTQLNHSPLFTEIVSPRGFLTGFLLFVALLNLIHYYADKLTRYLEHLATQGLSELAYRDHLTGLANRYSFERWAQAKLTSNRANTSLTALVFIDVDNFKQINDNYGHDVGDRVLKMVAERLNTSIQDAHDVNAGSYSLARYAGDEFIVMLTELADNQALEAILNTFCHMTDASQTKTHAYINELTISIGVAIYLRDADTLDELFRCADEAMYCAKQQGKNQHCYYQYITQSSSARQVREQQRAS